MTTAVLEASGHWRRFYQVAAGRTRPPSITRWARPWSPARAASSARTSFARSPSAATSCACSPGAARTSSRSTGSSSSGRPATSPTAAPSAGRWTGVDRVFHVAGRTSLRGARPRGRLRRQPARRADGLRGGARGRGRARSSTPRPPARSASRSRGGTADETTPFEIGHLGLAYVNSKHEAELEAFRLAAHGLPVVIVNPTFVLGPRGPDRHLDGPRAALPARPDPGLRRGRAQHRRRPRRRRRPPARRRRRAGSASATSSAVATSPSTACSPTSRGSPGSTRRR